MNKKESSFGSEAEGRNSAAKHLGKMVGEGANIVEGGRLEVTPNQVEMARMEMLAEQTGKRIREAIDSLGPDFDNVIKYLDSQDNKFIGTKEKFSDPEWVSTKFLLRVLKASKDKSV